MARATTSDRRSVQLGLELESEFVPSQLGEKGGASASNRQTFVVATWNVNSVRARLHLLLEWLAANQPDVLCLQETKVSDDQFPAEAFARLGYRAAVHGQQRQNGVAILSQRSLDGVQMGFGQGPEAEARVLAATVRGIRVVTVYAPNAQSLSHPSFRHKVEWLLRLAQYVRQVSGGHSHLLLCGDFNVAPRDVDVDDPSMWLYQTFVHPDARAALRQITGESLTDVYLAEKGGAIGYTWFDYRTDAVLANRGMRIDHLYATRALAKLCTRVLVDVEARRANKPSDHAPVLAHFNLPPLSASEPYAAGGPLAGPHRGSDDLS